MKKITLNKYKIHFGWRIKFVALLGLFIIAVGFMYATLRRVNAWYAGHELVFNKVVSIEFKKPIEIKKREVEIKQIVQVINEIPNPVDLKTDTEKYIYEIFGIENYKVAIAIARAESGLREDAININTNDTVDIGIFQINSIHYKKAECQLKDIVTYKGNVDCAYKIYKASGWTPWTVFNTGAFTAKLD